MPPKKKPDEEIIFSGKTFDIINRKIKMGDSLKTIEIARRSPGVRLLILDRKGKKILLTKEYRYELKGYDFRLPGGKVFDTLEGFHRALDQGMDPFDSALHAAKKECQEETGLNPTKITHLCTSNAGLTVEWDLHYFLVEEYTGSIDEQSLEESEDIVPEWKTFEEARKLCLEKMQEERSVAILLKFLEKNPYK
jgi:8-oxo-dGTP pyrophosphatase MutT (NUDIX family)